MPCHRLMWPLAHSTWGWDCSRDSSAAPAAQGPDLGLARCVSTAGQRGPCHHLHQPLPQVRTPTARRAARCRAPEPPLTAPPPPPPPHAGCREEEAAYLRARQHRLTPRTTAAPPPAPAAPPPAAGRELSLLAAQLRALADSLSPPSVAAAAPGWHPPEAAAFPHDATLARLLGNAMEGAGLPAAHAHYALCPPQ